MPLVLNPADSHTHTQRIAIQESAQAVSSTGNQSVQFPQFEINERLERQIEQEMKPCTIEQW
jgi:hypothetical protein